MSGPLIGRHWHATVSPVEGIEKEMASENVRKGRQNCALTNTENYFVSREWTPKTREEGNHRRVVYILGVVRGVGELRKSEEE